MTAYERIAEMIRQQILAGTLTSGDRLPTEAQMSSQYRVSRNTAREAFRLLASQGLVTIKRGVTGGVFVTVPRPAELAALLRAPLRLLVDNDQVTTSDLLDIRHMLEVAGAELAALNRSEAELEEMRSTQFDPESVTLSELYACSQKFHINLLHATHNPLLNIFLEPVARVLDDRLLSHQLPRGLCRQIHRDHGEIIHYLEIQDQAGAREATRAHLRYLARIYQTTGPITG